MASIKEEIAAIAADHGYTGAAPKTIAGAIDALADTLAGTDVKSGRSIAGAIHALAPYIGSGGGTTLGELVRVSSTSVVDDTMIYVATTAFDITSDTYLEVDDAIDEHANVCRVVSNAVAAPSGCYVTITTGVSSGWSPEGVQVYVGRTLTSDFECRKFTNAGMHFAVFTMQIPAEEVYVNFNDEGDIG